MFGLVGENQNKLAFFDSFNRADSNASMGNADTGQVWTSLQGTWGISDNKAYCISNTHKDLIMAPINKPNFFTECDLKGPYNNIAGSPYIVFRVLDAQNYLVARFFTTSFSSGVSIGKMVSNAFTQLANFDQEFTEGATHKIGVKMVGSTISVYMDGTLKVEHTLSGADLAFLTYPLNIGLREGGLIPNGTDRWEDLKVVGL